MLYSFGTYNWTFEDLEVWNTPSSVAEEPKVVNVEFVLVCIDPGCPPSGLHGPPEFYDPGAGATWEIDKIEIVFETAKTLTVTQEQLSQLFPNGDDMINNALEAAHYNGVVE